jgi:4-amino-4-deoxy-L-arabinose transferase-like glycosyltransferase
MVSKGQFSVAWSSRPPLSPITMSERFKALTRSGLYPYLTLLLWVVPLVLIRSSQQSLMAHDEGIYAAQARAILQTGDWIAPQWGGSFSFDRPIGIQWLIALCYQLFGISEDTVRLPSALAFIGSVLLVYRLGMLMLNRQMAWLGAAIFSVIPLSLQYARLGTQDAGLVFVELLAVWGLLEGENASQSIRLNPAALDSADRQTRRHSGWLLLTGAALGWGFMIKGFMVILAAIALLPYLMIHNRKHRHLHNPSLYIGLVLGWLPVAGWLAAAIHSHGWLPVDELFGKLVHLKGQTYQGAGPFYYLWNIPANGFPWVFFGLGGLVLCLQRGRYRDRLGTRRLLLLGFPMMLFSELMLFGTKTPYYPLQLMPWVALLAAVTLDKLQSRYLNQDADDHWGIAALSWGLGLLGLELALLALAVQFHGVSALGGLTSKELPRLSLVALGWGILWLALLGCWRWRHGLNRSGQARRESWQGWLMCLLMGPWLGLALLNLSGLWGDYAPGLKQAVRQPAVQQVLRQGATDFVVNEPALDRQGRKTYLLLNFYTPMVGQQWGQWPTGVQPDRVWIAPTLSAAVPQGYAPIGIPYEGWQLVERR